MNRAVFAEVFSEFTNRLACAQLADEHLLNQANTQLEKYIEKLEGSYEAIDKFTLADLSEIYAYHHHDRKWIQNADCLDKLFEESELLILKHRDFLNSNLLTPDYLTNWGIRQKV